MPSLLAPPFPQLIQALPVGDHSFPVEAAFWQPKFCKEGQSALWSVIFPDGTDIRISRQRLLDFAYPTPEQKCAEILLWGYNRDPHGRVSRLLPVLSQLPTLATSEAAWPGYFDALDALDHMGISTITKLAHFHGRSFGGQDALILDDRLIERTARWSEVQVPGLARHSARARYPDYLRVMHTTAAQLHCTAAQLELFLFTFGDSF